MIIRLPRLETDPRMIEILNLCWFEANCFSITKRGPNWHYYPPAYCYFFLTAEEVGQLMGGN